MTARTPTAAAPAVEVDTVVVGAGFAGLGMGIRMLRAGDTSFVVLERAEAVGGTWRDNVYPGVACDIPSHLYSFSFAPKTDWTRFFAPGAEIGAYLRECAREIEPHLRLGTDMLDASWSDETRRWRVATTTGDYLCRSLVMAAGRLSEARMPEVSGLGSFSGEVVHSSRWDASVDLRGKRVGVVGTGASAVQLVPHLAEAADSVVVFQRTAPYVVPRGDSAYSADDIRRFAAEPAERESLRARLFWASETGFAERLGTPGFVDRLRDRALGHLAGQVADPALRERLTPSYEIGCKRVLLSDDYYPALGRDDVDLVPSALVSVDGRTATAANGESAEVDVLVFATGFESTRPPFARRIAGRDGLRLAEAWRGGMVAFDSTTVHGFPNLYVIDGPNASLGHSSAIVMIEAQIGYVLGALGDPADVLEVSAERQAEYVAELDAKAAGTVWLGGGCDSWYVDASSRRLTLLWPDFAYAFVDRLAAFDRSAYVATSR